MKTHYDLLGICPDADDDALKKAFRRAAKAHHPDLHAGDPDAPVRFRRIIAANAILRDAKQRASYDRLVELKRQQLRSKWRRIIISDTIAVAVLTASLLGGYGYGLFVSTSTTEIMAVKDNDTSTAAEAAKVDMDGVGGPIEFAAVRSATPTNMTGQDRPHDKHEGVAVTGGVSKPSTAAATSSGDVEIIADRWAAIGPLTNDANFYRERGIASYRSGNFRQAIGSLDEAIRFDPKDAQAYNIRANTWDEMGVFERAVADYDEAIRIDPNNPALFHDRGVMWQRKGELDKALVDLDRAIRFSFADANVYCERGLVWYEKGHRDRAIADFNQAIKLDPNLVATCINRGLIVHRSGEFKVARAYGDKAIRVDPRIFDTMWRINSRP